MTTTKRGTKYRWSRPHPSLIDLKGERFGRWTVCKHARTRYTPGGVARTEWVCICDCGAVRVVDGQHLRRGETGGCKTCSAADVRLHGRKGDPCPCGKPTREGKSECPACSRRAVRNGRYPCNHARYLTKPECPICPGRPA